MKKFAAISVLIMGIILLSGCTSLKSESTIVGKWQEDDGTTIEFFEDGTANLVAETYSEIFEYEFVDDNNIRLTSSEGNTGVMGVSVSTNELIIDESGSMTKLKRIGATKDVTNTGELSNKNIKIQNKLETPEGYIVKIERMEEDFIPEDKIYIKGLIENPTNNPLQYTNQLEVGVLFKYVDEYNLDKNSEWANARGANFEMQSFYGGIEPRHSAPFEFNSDFPKSTSEIKPYMILNGNVYPPCFTGDPRNQCS